MFGDFDLGSAGVAVRAMRYLFCVWVFRLRVKNDAWEE